MSHLAKILVQVKVTRAQSLRSRKMDERKYHAFIDAVCELYKFLDDTDIEALEKIDRKKG